MRPIRTLCIPLIVVLLCGAATDDSPPRTVVEFSEHGSVLGPMERTAAPEDEEAALGTFVAGLEHMQAASYEKAAELFDRLATSMGWPEAAYNASLAWYAAGRFDVALARAEGVAELLPDDVGAMYLRGVLLQAVGRHEDATAVIRGSLDKSREAGRQLDVAVGLLNLGSSARLLGRPTEALEHFRAARELGDQLGLEGVVAAGWMGEGNVHLSTGDRTAAAAALAAGRRLGKTRGLGAAAADADLTFAAVAASEGKVGKARRLLEGAHLAVSEIEEVSVRASMLLTVAQLQRELGEKEAAEVSIAEAGRLFGQAGLDVGRAHALQYRGAWALDEDNLPEAERLLEEARAVQERFQVPLALADTRRHLATLRAAQGRLDDALLLAQQACDTFAQARAHEAERAALVVLAAVRSQREELPEARIAAVRAIELAEAVDDHTEAHRVRSEVAIIDAAAGDLDSAEAALAAIPAPAFERLPAHQRSRVHLQLAWALHRAGRFDEAEARGRSALAVAAGDDPQADLADSAREVVVFAMLDDGRAEEAEAFLAESGRPDEELATAIRGRRTVDTYNEGVRLMQEGDLAGAVARFDVVWGDAEAEPSRRETAGKALAGALRGQGQELWGAGELEPAAAALSRAAQVAHELDDAAAEARALVLEASVRSQGGDDAAAGRLATRAAELAETGADSKLAGDCWMIAGQSLFDVTPEESRDAFLRALEAWGTTPESLGSRASVTYNLAMLALKLGSEQGARVRLEEARVLAGRAGQDALVGRIDEFMQDLDESEDEEPQ